MRVILVRHGQTDWNRAKRFRGRRDVPLNQAGLAQAEATARRIAAAWRPVAVYSSPLSRARETAMAIATRFGLTVRACPGLTDLDCGAWEGLTPGEVERRWPGALDDWHNAPESVRIPRGETIAQVRRRAWRVVRDRTRLHRNETIAIVGHSAVNRAVVLEVLGMGNDRFWHLGQETCCINIIEMRGGEFRLVTMNDTCHLHGAGSDDNSASGV